MPDFLIGAGYTAIATAAFFAVGWLIVHQPDFVVPVLAIVGFAMLGAGIAMKRRKEPRDA